MFKAPWAFTNIWHTCYASLSKKLQSEKSNLKASSAWHVLCMQSMHKEYMNGRWLWIAYILPCFLKQHKPNLLKIWCHWYEYLTSINQLISLDFVSLVYWTFFFFFLSFEIHLLVHACAHPILSTTLGTSVFFIMYSFLLSNSSSSFSLLFFPIYSSHFCFLTLPCLSLTSPFPIPCCII